MDRTCLHSVSNPRRPALAHFSVSQGSLQQERKPQHTSPTTQSKAHVSSDSRAGEMGVLLLLEGATGSQCRGTNKQARIVTISAAMIVKDREAWRVAVHGSQRLRHNLATKQQQHTQCKMKESFFVNSQANLNSKLTSKTATAK